MREDKKIVFLNGKFLPSQEARVSALEPGLLHGLGLFETMRSFKGKIVYLDAHLNRLKAGSAVIKIKFPYSFKTIKGAIARIIRLNQLSDARIRLTLWKAQKGADTLITASRYKPHTLAEYKKGFSVAISRFRSDEDSLFSRLKTTNRILYELSFREARDKGFDEALLLNSRGYIAEGSHSNIFLVKGNTIFTPGLECGCLPGITRSAVFALAKKYNIKTYEGRFTPQDLIGTDEAFLTNALIRIMPLRRMENKVVGKGRNKLTRFFMQKYNSLLRNGN